MRKAKVAIFGAGFEGKLSLKRIGKENVYAFVDNNTELQGKLLFQKKIISVEELCDVCASENIIVIISSQRYYWGMLNQLKENGIENAVSTTEFLIDEAFLCPNNSNRIVLMNTHAGTNMGDQIISEAEHEFFADFLPKYEVIELPADLISDGMELIKNKMSNRDIIAISGGGYMGSLWKSYGEDNVRSIIDSFPDNHIIVLPQSIYFEDTSEGLADLQLSKDYYSKHHNIDICVRERLSYKKLINMLGQEEKVHLFPDMAVLMNKTTGNVKRNKIGICLRNDKESIMAPQSVMEIKKCVEGDVVSFDMHSDEYVGISEREYLVNVMAGFISTFRYVITDRLHCMVLCAITGTPCIAFDNLTRKVSGVYEWIKENRYIHYTDDIEAAKTLMNYYKNNTKTYSYNQGLVLGYFSELAALFEK